MKSRAEAANGTHVTLSASGDENGDVMARPCADWKPTRYRIDVVGPSIADIFWSVGGWIVDRAMAGWDVIRGDDGSVLEPGQTGELFVRFRDGAGASRRAAVFIVHGTPDGVVPVQQARSFVEKLRTASRSTIGYLELPGAQHGVDMTDAPDRNGGHGDRLVPQRIHRSHLRRIAKEVV
jgi:pimeloyl-ACP methyl ester carboxylesterase